MAYEENNPGIFEFSDENNEIEGVLIKIQDNVGSQNSMLYTLETQADKPPVSIWGSAILDQRMMGIKQGDKIKVIYKGLGEASPGKNPPKIFQVLVDRPEEEVQEEEIGL